MSDVRNDRNDRRLDPSERAGAHTPADEAAGDARPDATGAMRPARPVRKELTQDDFDKSIEGLTYALTAPAPMQAWHVVKSAVEAFGTTPGDEPSRPSNPVSGARLYPLIENELPKTSRSDEQSAARAGEYVLHPQIAVDAKGGETVAYYTAVRHGRAEWAVGTDALETFKAHHEMYAQLADQSWSITSGRPYEQDTYRMGEAISNGDPKGAAIANFHAWEHAWSDPTWAAQRALDVAVAMAPEAPRAKPTTTADPSLPRGTGITDKYGNVRYSTQGTTQDIALVKAHESVHSFLSPKALNGLRAFRAEARMAAYDKSALCKYLEEALAETYAQVKVNGVTAIPEGLRFPIREGYVTFGRVATEAAVGTLVYGGVTYWVCVEVGK
jgi:hypothetical protein